LLERKPDFSARFVREYVFYNKVKAHLDYYIEGLGKAGIQASARLQQCSQPAKCRANRGCSGGCRVSLLALDKSRRAQHTHLDPDGVVHIEYRLSDRPGARVKSVSGCLQPQRREAGQCQAMPWVATTTSVQHQATPLHDPACRLQPQIEVALNRQETLRRRQYDPAGTDDLCPVTDRNVDRVCVVLVAVAHICQGTGGGPTPFHNLCTAQPVHRVEVVRNLTASYDEGRDG
jgi:hypothetical protein